MLEKSYRNNRSLRGMIIFVLLGFVILGCGVENLIPRNNNPLLGRGDIDYCVSEMLAENPDIEDLSDVGNSASGLNIFWPNSALNHETKSASGYPVVIFLHGQPASINTFNTEAQWATDNGYVAINFNYRQKNILQSIEDIDCGVKWIKAHHDTLNEPMDVERIALVAHSFAGMPGHLIGAGATREKIENSPYWDTRTNDLVFTESLHDWMNVENTEGHRLNDYSSDVASVVIINSSSDAVLATSGGSLLLNYDVNDLEDWVAPSPYHFPELVPEAILPGSVSYCDETGEFKNAGNDTDNETVTYFFLESENILECAETSPDQWEIAIAGTAQSSTDMLNILSFYHVPDSPVKASGGTPYLLLTGHLDPKVPSVNSYGSLHYLTLDSLSEPFDIRPYGATQLVAHFDQGHGFDQFSASIHAFISASIGDPTGPENDINIDHCALTTEDCRQIGHLDELAL
ncbi:MAG: hypothetical protein KUG82_16295 [Pseudomonadales bacterium]|nr:hypothetical protein [Pseudomonadales bacterium]